MTFQTVQNFTDQEGVDTDRLNALISNQQYLFENQVPMQYNAYGEQKSENLKIASGVAKIGGKKVQWREIDVSFGGFFSTGSRPVVTASHATLDRRDCFIWIMGYGGNSIHPTHSGFRVGIAHKPDYLHLDRDQRIHWIAAGY